VSFTGHSRDSVVEKLADTINDEPPMRPCPGEVARGMASLNKWPRNRPSKNEED